ncbi:MAG TPA: glutamate-5-semialdehyde dehydrogenase [Candidatus Acidoferrales bacterium]|jgi:glutamate-5-semialdehyde dehydrogenase|nr:glutamate-5-semialdehyde dehydrogenase [Candidatus Acidoferrales bacterium]
MSHTVAAAIDEESVSVASVTHRARAASRELPKLSAKQRNDVLLAAAKAIEQNAKQILEANAADCRAAEPAVASGKMSAAMFARLRLKESGVAQMAAQIREVARMDDPLGRRLAATELDKGLVLHRETCPIGVIGVIFESRPDVVPQLASLALKSGNAVILKGGSEAAHTNQALVSIWRECLKRFPAVPLDSISLLQSRAAVLELLAMDHDVDLIIPRGSYELVRFIMEHSRIPVLGHGEGICHVYVERGADLQKAADITYDSKVQYPAVCNAVETLLVDEAIAAKFLRRIVPKLKEAGVEIRGCAKTSALLPKAGIVPATEQDWRTEYGDLILSIKVVPGIDEAIEHINRYGSHHTDAIVTENAEAAKKFLNEVDSAGVFHNASTRFADGFRYGFGAEVGISTNKLHARGPMGLEGLTTYKYKLHGSGQTVAPYVKGEKKFKHRRSK